VTINFANPAAQTREQRTQINEAIASVLEGDIYIHGPAHDRFESEFADYLGAKYALGVANGTEAIVLALRASGIGPGDEVITPSHTAPATISAIRQSGALPRFVDVNYLTYVVEIDEVSVAIGPKTKAIIGVHLYGMPFDAIAMRKLCDERQIILIEDCAQATGASIGGKRVGTIGHFGCFSFFPTKNLGCIGDGGAVVTNDNQRAEHIRRLRLYGWSSERLCIEDGINSRLDEMQAAILSVKLKYLDVYNKKRRDIAAIYNQKLKGLKLDLPKIPKQGKEVHVFHLYVIGCDQRDKLKEHMFNDNIVCGIHYLVPNHMHPAHKIYCNLALPQTEILTKRILSLPMYPELSNDNIERVCSSIHKFLL